MYSPVDPDALTVTSTRPAAAVTGTVPTICWLAAFRAVLLMKEVAGSVLIPLIVSVAPFSRLDSDMVKGCPAKILCSGATTM